MKARAKDIAKNSLLAVGTLIVFAGIAEAVLQFVMPMVYRPRFTKVDAEVGWYHNASVETRDVLEGHEYRSSYNSHGYRSPEHAFEKPVGSRRVVLLGDSFIDGAEVGDTELHSWHLQEAMPNTEVVNLGVYGYSTAQQALTVPRALRYSPDLVVLVTLTNDFRGNTQNLSYFGPAPRYVLDADSIRLESTTSAPARAAFRSVNLPVPGMTFLHEHSLLYYFLNHFVYQRFFAKKIDGIMAAQRAAVSAEDQLELYRRIVGRMKTLCDANGVDFLVVFAYERYELRPEASPLSDAARVLQQDGIPTFDLHAGLKMAEAAADSSIYYENDIHWNVRGHRVVANLLQPEIERRLQARRPSSQ